MKNLMDLFQLTIKDIYNSENQLIKGMQRMEEKADSPKLKEAFRKHIEQTREHVNRIQRICNDLGFEPGGETCQGTLGLVKEAQEHIEQFGSSPVGDAAIIACAQKCEHYEIANYGTVITWAEDLDIDQALIELLELTLQEEEEADDLLTMIAEDEANPKAARTANKAQML